MRRSFRIGLDIMIDDVNTAYDREPMMALRAVNCISRALRSLVHVGIFHAWSIHYDPSLFETQVEKRGPGWRTVSQFIHDLVPSKSIVTINTAQPADPKPDPLQNSFKAANQIFHAGNPRALSLLPTYSAPAELKAALREISDRGKSTTIWPVWDYLVLGPIGDYAPLWD